MKLFSAIEKTFKSLLPSPFTIALLLTGVTFLLAWFGTSTEVRTFELGEFGSFNVNGPSFWQRPIELVDYWGKGLWNQPLLAFAVQMMLMLVLGHVLALTKPIDRFISYVTQFCNSTANAAFIVTLLTVCVALFNWGLGLIFGAILARKVGEHAAKRGIQLNYALIGAAGYSGLMVWHGGISGSAPIKVAEEGHITEMMQGVSGTSQLNGIPSSISMSETVFGTMNSVTMIALMVLLPLFMFWLGKRTKKSTQLPVIEMKSKSSVDEETVVGAERLDRSMLFSLFFGLLIVSYAVYLGVDGYSKKGLEFINPNFINLFLFGLCLTMHRSIREFLKAVDKAIGGTSGILIQFPLYFGIMGIMKHSGLVDGMSNFFVSISNEVTFPIYTFFSAGIVNVFVPSGGGQWAVQGPIIIQAASELGVSAPKAIMALSYGDQLTNMLQPFWALPLLGITGLKAKSILPYTVALMGVGILIFVSMLLIF